ncbi:MAG: bifunctional methylenetetrahydrofolate dehydrogenase/methenyltetrahydrofolate cyclohydrolase FolD [Clostridia bacterium]|nr:bifunctional methylenetetrahydrofolate dehydrogenase/methenyltetrahydrofolate cyclohydrolase FolD [Clostridia bacterium]
MTTIIDGKAIAKEIRKEVKIDAISFFEKHGRKPGLSVILVGDDPASCIYVNNKQKACEKAEMNANTIKLPKNTSMDELLDVIDSLNTDKNVDGILVQLPLPEHLNAELVLNRILPEKDVDGFHPINAGQLLQNKAVLEPCTPKGCMELLKRSGISLSGLNAAVIGRSNLVGKPVSMMLLRENATVTICHSKTKDLKAILKNADVVIAAVGKPKLITGDMLKPGAIVLDVGINRLEDGSITGDVEFESASQVASYITPVPGGVGPMTIAMLLKNTMLAAEAQNV